MQEFAECLPVVLVAEGPDKNVFHTFVGVFTHVLAGIHKGVHDGCTDCGIVPATLGVLPSQGQWPDGILDKVVVNAELPAIHIAS